MIKSIIQILKKMESACPVKCFPNLHASNQGHLVMKWRWEYKGEAHNYSQVLSKECDNDVIDRVIHKATKEIALQMNVDYITNG